MCLKNESIKPKIVRSKIVRSLINYFRNEKCCIYNDRIASEFDDNVIKTIEKNRPRTIVVLGYSPNTYFDIDYEVLSSKGKNKYEDFHPVFKTSKQKVYGKEPLFSYASKVKNENGYVIGLENASKRIFDLRLKLNDGYDIDPNEDFYGKDEFEFTINPSEKKIFNIRYKKNNNNEYNFKFRSISCKT